MNELGFINVFHPRGILYKWAYLNKRCSDFTEAEFHLVWVIGGQITRVHLVFFGFVMTKGPG